MTIWKDKITKLTSEFKRNKTKFLFDTFNWLLLFALFVSLPLFSISHHLVPIILTILLSVSLFISIFLFGKFHINFFIIFMAAFLLHAIFVTFIFSKNFSNLKTFINIILLFFVLCEFCYYTKNIRLIMLLYILSILLFSIVFLVYYHSSIVLFFSGKNIRIGDDFDNVNSVASFLLAACVMSFAYILMYKKYVIEILTIAMALLCILMTGSRMAILGFLITIITFAFLLLFKKHKLILFISLTVFAIAIILVFSIPAFGILKERILSIFTTLFSDGSDQSTANRFGMLLNGLDNWLKNAFLGWGAGGFGYVSAKTSYSHATLSDVLCNFGLIGTFLFFSPMFYCLFTTKRGSKSFIFFVLFILGFVLIGMFGTVILQRKHLYIMLAIGYFIYSEEHFNELSYFDISFLKMEGIKKKFGFQIVSNVGKSLITIRSTIKEIKYE